MDGRSIGAQIASAAFGKLSDAVLVVSDDRIVCDANAAACVLFQRTRDALIGEKITELPESVWSLIARGESGKLEIDMLLCEGRRATIAVSATANVTPNTHFLILRDESERRRRELMSERYELLARHTHDIVLFLRRDGSIVEANDAAVKAYGYTRAELLGLFVADLRDPPTRFDVEMQIERAFSTGVILETVHRRKDGSTFPVEVGSRSAHIGGELMLLSVIRDITDRRQIQAGLVQADRLSTFGMMAAGIAHEINNPLAYAITNIDVLARRIAALSTNARRALDGENPPPDGLSTGLDHCAEMILIAQEGMGRVRSIVRDLKMFSRDDGEAKERIDIRTILESSINIARGEIRHRARVVRDYGDVPLVEGSASRLGQVFLNLLVNAAQAIPSDRTDGEIRVVTQTAPNGDALVDVVDNGVGIEPDAMERIFDPFVTTKPAGEGTGLGLHIARTIARASGGDVRVESRVGVGTTMRVSIPSAQRSSLGFVTTHAGASPGARVLIVDDEAPLGITLRALLSPPHDVVVTTNGADALAHIDSGECFDVIFCDIMMPHMSGIRFYETLAAAHPEVARRIVFMTGGISAPEVHKFLQITDARCLEKPFTDTELEDAIAEVLARA